MKRIAAALIAAGLICGVLGCQELSKKPAATQPKVAELPPIPDRLRAFYHELQAGKFEVLADLEQPAQTQVFRVEGAGLAQLTVRRSRIPTGAGALEVRLDDAEAMLVADNLAAKDWALSHNWSPYELLMASVHAPAPTAVSLQVRSGTDEPAWWVSDVRPLQPGWNLLRIDLREVGRRVDLANVRQMRLLVKSDSYPLTLYVDDLMLADNTTTLFGNAQGEAGDLYVQKKGRRFHVGSVGRFELVFNRGMLQSWYDLSVDPDKAVDLAAGGPAGPVLTALDGSGAPLGTVGTESWAGLGGQVQTRLQVLDSSPLSVTIKGTIRFAAGTGEDTDEPAAGVSQSSTAPARGPADRQTSEAAPAADTQPAAASEHTYVYTIRQDGRVFVDISATVASETFQPAGIGLAVTTLNAPFQLKQVDPLDADLLRAMSDKLSSSQPATQEALDNQPQREPLPRALLLARVRPGGTNVLLAPGQVAAFRRVVSATRQTGDITAHLYAMDPPASGKTRLAAMLAIWPPDLRDLPTAAAIARDYQQPCPPEVEVGRLRTDAPGDLDGDGFAEATGQWVVEPDGQVLRLRWPAGQLRFWPMLHIANLAGKACWPYLDGRIIKPVERKPNGDAEFVVPGILSRTALLEVTVEK